MYKENIIPYQKYFLFIMVATFTMYIPALNGPFIYDDFRQIVGNKNITNPDSLFDVIFNGLRQIRIVQNLSHAFNWWFSNGFPWSFKLFNVLVHLINSFLLFKLTTKIFDNKKNSIAFVSSAIFLMHPLNTQAITFVMGGISLLQAMFYLLALLIFDKYELSKKKYLYLLVFISFFVKETCTLIPVTLLAYKLTIKKGSFASVKWREWLPFLAFPSLFIPILYFFIDSHNQYSATTGFHLWDPYIYILSQFKYFLLHLFQFIVPVYRSLIHPHTEELTQTMLLTSLAGFIIFSLSMIWACRNFRKNLSIVFFIFFYLITILPTNSFVQVINPYAEYRLYQANISLCIIGILLFYKSRFFHLISAQFKIILLICTLIYFSLFTVRQNVIWVESERIFLNSLKTYPGSKDLNLLFYKYLISVNNLDDALVALVNSYYSTGKADRLRVQFLHELYKLFEYNKRFDKSLYVIEILERDADKRYGHFKERFYLDKINILLKLNKIEQAELERAKLKK